VNDRLGVVNEASAVTFTMDIGYAVVDFSKLSAEILHIFIHNTLVLVSVDAEFRNIDLLLLDRLVRFIVLLN